MYCWSQGDNDEQCEQWWNETLLVGEAIHNAHEKGVKLDEL